MKQNKRLFNHLLYIYNKSKRKLVKLRSENKNIRKQAIIAKRIEKLHAQLSNLLVTIKKLSVAGALVAGAMALQTTDVNAQSPIFDAKQVNPFNLSGAYYSNPKPEFVDIDGDGDYDVFANYGYYGPSEFQYYENVGTNAAPSFAAPVNNPFGLTTYSYSIGLYYNDLTFDFVDIDGDGDFDLYAKANYNSNFFYFENTGTNTSPAFAAPVLASIPGSGGYEQFPHFADIDGDGDFDMISGDYYYGYYSSGPRFKYYENTGNNNSPAFALPVINPFGLNPSVGGLAPEFVDIDNDGDFDLMSGAANRNDGFVFFENTGSNNAPAFGPEQILPFNLSVGYYDNHTHPTMVDLDNDGNIDLLSGNDYGEFIYYRNKGICFPTSSTISPVAVCSYTSPAGNLYTLSNTYTETIQNFGGCDSIITINLTINSIVDQTISASPSIVCGSGSSMINLASTQDGVSYFLRNDLNDTIVDGPIVGNGSGISFNTGNISTATTYNIFAEKSIPTKALMFDGNDDKVDCGNDPSLQLSGNQITLEAWIYPTAWQWAVWAGNIINKEAGGPDNGYMLRCGDNGRLNFNLGNGSWNEVTSAQNALTLNTWQHVAGTYDGSVMSIYVNGVLVGSQNYTNLNFASPNENLSIGNWSQGTDRPFQGKIDEARIWSTAKTQTEIQNSMNNCLSGTEIGLEAYYQFEDASTGATLTDLTSNGNDGTLENMVSSAWDDGYPICSNCSAEMTNTITVEIGQPTSSTISATECVSYTSPSGNNTYTISGSYLDTIPNAIGCDSVITINLTINTVDVTVIDASPTLTANATGGTYQWLDCNNSNAVITGETAQSFTAAANGSYAVSITQNSCTDTSACFTINNVGIVESPFDELSVYPNPTSDVITISVPYINGLYAYEIMTPDGKVIMAQNSLSNKVFSIDLSSQSAGIYFLRIVGAEDSKLIKVVKQ